jgi:energy-coupling factor transport system permease protein
MSVMFEFEAANTPIHRLNPVTKMVIFFSITVLAGFYMDIRYKLPLLLLLICLCLVAKLPFKRYTGLILVATLAVLITSSYRSIFMINPDYFKSIPHDFAMTQLFQVTPVGTPIIGRTAVTFGSLMWMVSLPISTITVGLSMATLMHTTSQSEITQTLSASRLPAPAVFIIMVALRFIPEMIRQLQTIQTAQRLRGWNIKSRNPIKIAKGYMPLMVPIARYIVESVDRMTISSKNRAFGLRRSTGLVDLTLRPLDIFLVVCTCAAFITCTYLLFVFNMGAL